MRKREREGGIEREREREREDELVVRFLASNFLKGGIVVVDIVSVYLKHFHDAKEDVTNTLTLSVPVRHA